jgi:hypothetical protein
MKSYSEGHELSTLFQAHYDDIRIRTRFSYYYYSTMILVTNNIIFNTLLLVRVCIA